MVIPFQSTEASKFTLLLRKVNMYERFEDILNYLRKMHVRKHGEIYLLENGIFA